MLLSYPRANACYGEQAMTACVQFQVSLKRTIWIWSLEIRGRRGYKFLSFLLSSPPVFLWSINSVHFPGGMDNFCDCSYRYQSLLLLTTTLAKSKRIEFPSLWCHDTKRTPIPLKNESRPIHKYILRNKPDTPIRNTSIQNVIARTPIN